MTKNLTVEEGGDMLLKDIKLGYVASTIPHERKAEIYPRMLEDIDESVKFGRLEREALELFYGLDGRGGMTYAEMGKVLHVSPSYAGARMRFGRIRLETHALEIERYLKDLIKEE